MTIHGAGTFGATPKTRRRARVLIRAAVLALPPGAVRDR